MRVELNVEVTDGGVSLFSSQGNLLYFSQPGNMDATLRNVLLELVEEQEGDSQNYFQGLKEAISHG